MAEIHAVSLLQFAPFLARRGIDVLEFFNRERVAPNIFRAHDAWLPRAECLRLANALIDVTGDPCACAGLGNTARLSDFGEFGRRVIHAESVAVACRAAIANLGLLHRGSRLITAYEGDHLFLRFLFEGTLEHDPRQFILATLAVLRNIVLLAGETDMMTVRFAVPYEPQWAALEASLGNRLQFGCDVDGLLISRSLLEKPLASPQGIGRDHDALPTTVQAAHIIAAMLPESPVRIDAIATQLGLTRRTLQRRLRDCGVVFSDLVDVTRRDAALRYLASGHQNLTELTMRLGYSDPAHFTRSFKRWMATTPSAFMRR